MTEAGIGFARQNNFDIGATSVDADGNVHVDTKTIGDSALGLAQEKGVNIGNSHMDADGNLHVDPAVGLCTLNQVDP
jgi:hypothetical protein